MSQPAEKPHLATAADLLALPEDSRFHEVISGELVRKAAPTGEHGDAQLGLGAQLRGPFHRRTGGPLPGGWWLYTEVEVELDAHEVYRPDVVGWRRERVPERPIGSPIKIRPDWVCEVLSPSNTRNDLIKKKEIYQRRQVPHYWIVDPMREDLSVYRWTAAGYLWVLTAQRGERVHAEPFDAVELDVGALFSDEAG